METVFPISGVETFLWLPPLVAFAVSFLTSMAGISGAFLLLPFQMSVLGFEGPAVSPTNLFYNIVATPGGVYSYVREKRVFWPLAFVLITGTVPGVILGGIVRLAYLPDPESFKPFAGIVLSYVGVRLFVDCAKSRSAASTVTMETATAPPVRAMSTEWSVDLLEFSWRRVAYRFGNRTYTGPTLGVFALSLVVGAVAGAYGIGGGAIIAPFLVAVYGLPVYTIAGATLLVTFVTSFAGVLFYQIAAYEYASSGLVVRPDWMLGAMFGLGGICGMYFGARTQKFVPAFWIKLMVGLLVLIVGVRYVAGFFFA